MHMFFTKRPQMPGSTPPRQDKDKARMLKTPSEIKEAWNTIFEVRRQYESDDRQGISDQDLLANMWNQWARKWMAEELTPEQRKRTHIRKTSIFSAWVFSQMGGKNFVMAIWQTGMTWAPSSDLLNSNFNGALEHVAKHFASWTRQLARAVLRHKQDRATVEARRRSGDTYGKHGLTAQEEQDRKEREQARRNYYLTQDLDKRLQASKGKGQGKGKAKTKRGASEHTRGASEDMIEPKSWEEMSKSERSWLDAYWNGNLKRAMMHADAKCHKVQAGRFLILEDD